MRHFFKQHYHTLFSTANAEASIFAIRTSIAMLTAAFLAFFFHFSAPYWAVITVIALMNTYTGLTIQKGIYRVMGTIAGAMIGLILARWINDIYTLLIIVLTTIFIFQYFSEISPYRYAFILCSVTTFMVLGSIVSGPDVPLQMAIWRCAEILLGVAVVSMVAVCILPKDPGYWLHLEMRNYFNCCNNLYHQIIFVQLGKEPTAIETQKNLNNLVTLLEKIKVHYEAYRQEPNIRSYHIHEANQLIDILKKLQNTFKLMALTFAHTEDYYWLILFKENIGKIAISFETIFLKLSMCEQHNIKTDLDVLLSAQTTIDEIKQKISVMRSSGELQNHSVYHNQALYVFLIQQQQLIDTLKILTENIKTQVPVISESYFSKIVSFKKDPIIIRHSIKTALASTLSMFVWIWVGWPGGLQGIVSVIAVATNIYLDDMWPYSFRRLMGCALGGAVGLISLHFLIYNIFDLLIVVLVVGFVFAFYTNRSKKFTYAALQANVAFALTLIQPGGPTDSIAAPLGRLSGIVLGIVSIMAINYLIWPFNTKKIFQQKVKNLSANVSSFLGQLKLNLFQRDDSKIFLQLQTELAECNKLYGSINAVLDEVIPAEKTVKRQFKAVDFTLTNLSIIMQYTDLAQAFAIAEKININLKTMILQALKLLDDTINNPTIITQDNINEFDTFVLNEYNHFRQSKKTFNYSLESIANFSFVIYQLRLLVKEIKHNIYH